MRFREYAAYRGPRCCAPTLTKRPCPFYARIRGYCYRHDALRRKRVRESRLTHAPRFR